MPFDLVDRIILCYPENLWWGDGLQYCPSLARSNEIFLAFALVGGAPAVKELAGWPGGESIVARRDARLAVVVVVVVVVCCCCCVVVC